MMSCELSSVVAKSACNGAMSRSSSAAETDNNCVVAMNNEFFVVVVVVVVVVDFATKEFCNVMSASVSAA